jgi:hypothetical protein
MKQAAKPDASQAPKAAAEPARPRPSQQAAAPDGPLSQLAVMMNGSPRGQALAQPKDAIQQSPRVQSLVSLSAEINQSAPAQLRSVDEKHPVQGKFLLKDSASATPQMKAATKLFMAAIRTLNGELVQLIDASDDINVVIDPGTAFGVAGSGETKLERQTSAKGKPETFTNTLSEIVDTEKVTDEMRTQPLVLRIKVNQKGLSGLTSGDATQLAATLAHEYSLHAEAQLEAIKALRNRSLSNQDALKAIVTSANDHGGFNNAEAQHAQLTNKKGDRYDAMVAVINEMKKNLTKSDATELQTIFEADSRDWH